MGGVGYNGGFEQPRQTGSNLETAVLMDVLGAD
jgi:hypothetical protein